MCGLPNLPTAKHRNCSCLADWWARFFQRRRCHPRCRGCPGRPREAPGWGQAPRHRSLTIDGYEIFVGRNSRENDTLTFQVAHPEDFWMHVGDYGGSHVVVRNSAKERVLPDNVLTKAAQLAAYFSQARNSSKVEVHYTQRRHVSKPRRAKPGLVKLSEFLSIRVEPKNWFDE